MFGHGKSQGKELVLQPQLGAFLLPYPRKQFKGVYALVYLLQDGGTGPPLASTLAKCNDLLAMHALPRHPNDICSQV